MRLSFLAWNLGELVEVDGARWPCGRVQDSGTRGRGVRPLPGRRVVSLSKTHLLLKSTGNTQEAMVPSRHDWKIIYWDVKLKLNKTKQVDTKADQIKAMLTLNTEKMK